MVGQFSITSKHLADLHLEVVSDEFIADTWKSIRDAVTKLNEPVSKRGLSKLYVRAVCWELAAKFDIADVEAVDTGSEHADRRGRRGLTERSCTKLIRYYRRNPGNPTYARLLLKGWAVPHGR
jgi:hypothetical protein